ncbi:interleukin-7 receptor subunit alpha [Pseudophryne corroboree]|uniref:interleukin-7 receptor subunit alpha n=1 Tax=Pseudophryne corroboree TaxID=495146 RepID=UPI0030812370
MRSSALGIILCLLVQPSMEESGDFPETDYDEEVEGEARMAFQCFTKFRINNTTVFCTATNITADNRQPVRFKLCTTSQCETKGQHEAININPVFQDVSICMMWIRNTSCQNYSVNKNALPDPPLNLFINYNNETEEYVFNIETSYRNSEYLKDKLRHEIVLRTEREEWPECENKTYRIAIYKRCFDTTTSDLLILKRNLEYSTKYEARVRSKTYGGYFAGPWSQWSKTVVFETDTVKNKTEGDFLLVILSTVIVLVLLFVAVLIAVFWKRSIKPLVWPEIPDHKTTLEKLCKKPKKDLHMSFNPDYFENMPINKVDYMKALVRTEDSLQFSTTDIPVEKPLKANACNNISSPGEGSRTVITTTTRDDLSDHVNGTETLGDNSMENPNANVLPSCASVSECTPSNDGCTVMSGPGAGTAPMCPDNVKQPNNGLKVLCWEEIYIAMSAFKTPNAAVKQVPHNRF